MISAEYLAGFIDGEGCLGFTKSGTVMVPRITITNTNLELLLVIKSMYGGSICKHKHNPKWKQGYGLNITSRKAMNLLDIIYPFLIIKKPQAELFYLYDKSRCGMGKTKNEAQILEFKNKMHFLNKKGAQQ